MAAPHQGQWEIIQDVSRNPKNSLVTAIHANLIPIISDPSQHPESKVLYWHGRYITNYDDGGKIVSCLYDPKTTEIVQYTVPVWPNITEPFDPSKIFCSAHIQLPDGKLLTAGGERNIPPVASRGIKYSFIFDSLRINLSNPGPWRNTRTEIDQIPTMMSKGRWYPQLTKLQNGNIVAMSGYKYESQQIEIKAELFEPVTETWLTYPDEVDLAVPLYNGAYLIPFGDWKGEIFYDLVSFGPELPGWVRAHRFNPDINSPSWNQVGSQQTMRYRGNSAVLPFRSTDNKIRIINLGGGNDSYSKTAQLIEIGDNVNSDWISLPDMSYQRHDAPCALILADESLMVIGGGHDLQTTLTPEILDYSDPDPKNWKWSNLPDMTVPRKYHSTGLLLQDGSVWVAGSRIYDNPQRIEFENDMERRIEIYKPGYFFEGLRPVIEGAPLVINYGNENSFEVTLDSSSGVDLQINSVALVSMANITHCFDNNQRYVILDFDELSPNKLLVYPPLDSHIAPPGYYMLFVINDKSKSDSGETRIPSVAKIIKVF
ncbi:MAG: DUF1929 domain-containing protein [Ignavibacteriae bacterium]|nr:DUF1929 domain-containing protein [Ignavibacteriota bacterium]